MPQLVRYVLCGGKKVSVILVLLVITVVVAVGAIALQLYQAAEERKVEQPVIEETYQGVVSYYLRHAENEMTVLALDLLTAQQGTIIQQAVAEQLAEAGYPQELADCVTISRAMPEQNEVVEHAFGKVSIVLTGLSAEDYPGVEAAVQAGMQAVLVSVGEQLNSTLEVVKQVVPAQVEKQKVESPKSSADVLKECGKNTALALAVVLFVCVAGCMAGYLMNGNVHTVDTITEEYRLPLVGYSCWEKGNKKGLTSKIARWIYQKKGVQATSFDYVMKSLEMLTGGSVPMACCENHSTWMDRYLVKYEELSGCLYGDEAFLQKAKQAGCVCLCVELNKTKKKELDMALNVCRTHGISVLGVVAMERI